MRLLYLLIFSLVTTSTQSQSGGVKKLPEAINSSYQELAPVLSADGEQLYFSRAKHPQNMGMHSAADIWLSIKKTDGTWSKAINVGAPVNSNQNDQPAGLSVAVQQMQVFCKDQRSLKRVVKKGRSWGNPIPQQIKGFQPNTSKIKYFSSFDGRVLMISQEDSLSIGQNDIYVSFLEQADTWSTPIHCGTTLNSVYDELSMFLAADNKTLYFVSDRPGGEGKMDIYYSKRLDDTWGNWSNPQNLGSDINTKNNELSICMSVQGDQAFFVRSNSEGTDIYTGVLSESLRPEPIVLIKGHMKKENSEDYLEGKVILQSLEGDNKIDAFEAEPGGRFQFIAPYGKNLCLYPEAKGYFPTAEPINLSAQPIEELDYESSNLLASVQDNVAYASRDEEIVELQLHLRTLDDEMIALQDYRAEYIKEQEQSSSSFFDKSMLSDPELDALKHRYEQQFVAPIMEAKQDTIPELTDEEQAEITKGEVEDLKARYMRFYEYETNQKAVEEDVEREAQFLWSESKTNIESIDSDVLSDVEKNMRGKVESELREALVDEVAKELEVELTEREQAYFDLDSDNLQQQLKSGLTTPAEASWTVKGLEKEEAWEQALKRELELKLQEKGAKEVLKSQMEDEVKAQLKADMTYIAKREARNKVASDLERKMEMQMAFETLSAEKTATSTEVVQPLIPFDEMDKIVNNIPKIEQDLLLVPAEIGMSTELKTVVFEANTAQLKPESYKELSRVLNFLQQNNQLIVEVGVHTGGQLSHTTAYSLSERRAEQIASYLILNGIKKSRLVAKGYGKSLPIADNNTITGQKKNQRIELRIIGRQ